MSPAESPPVHCLRDRLTERMDLDPSTLKLARFVVPNAVTFNPMGHDVVVLGALLFRLLDTDEFEALLAHELAHLERRDGLIQSLVANVLQTVVGAGCLFISPVMFLMTGVAFSSAWVRGRPRSWTGTPARRVRPRLDELIGLFGFDLTVSVRSQSEKWEFAADARAVETTDKPMALASTLRKLKRAARPQHDLSSLWVYGEAEVGDSASDLLSTHPSTDECVKRLAVVADESMTRIEVR